MTTTFKVLFLDIDGVLRSGRSAMFLQNPHSQLLVASADPFDDMDWVAVGMIRTLCKKHEVKLVLSSAWRENWKLDVLGQKLGLEFLDATDTEEGTRGEQIQRWLNTHPEVTHYAIVDDNSGMLASQADHFVQTDFGEGLGYYNYKNLRDILDGKLGGNTKKRNVLMWEVDDEGMDRS